MGLNAGNAFGMKWYEFEAIFYGEYPAMREIIEGGVGFSVVRLIGSPIGDDKDGQFERQETYGNLKFRHAEMKEVKQDGHPTRHWVVKPRGNNSMKIIVNDYIIERRDSGARLYNVYIYPPNYTKNSGGEPWIGAYMTGVDNYSAEKAINFAKGVIRRSTSDQVVSSAIRKHEITKDTDAWLKSNPLLAARLGKTQDNLQPDFSVTEAENDVQEDNDSEEENPEKMTDEELDREIARLESLNDK
jgi:hypothetical protein